MAPRTTRNKMRYRAGSAIKKCDRILEDFKAIYDMAEGRSEVVNEHMGRLSVMIDGVKTILTMFREEL